MKLGLENKKQARWAAVLGVIAVLLVAYQILPLLTGAPSSAPAGSESAVPASAPRAGGRVTGKAAKRVRSENLDPTLRLDLLASSEQTKYEGSGRNIFVSQEEVVIPKPGAPAATDQKKVETYQPPTPPPPPPIPLKFFGFASAPGAPRKVFLSEGDDVFIAGEGEVVDRRYRVVKINLMSVEIEDVLSNNRQTIPLTQG